jgi:hypothetical protein
MRAPDKLAGIRLRVKQKMAPPDHALLMMFFQPTAEGIEARKRSICSVHPGMNGGLVILPRHVAHSQNSSPQHPWQF